MRLGELTCLRASSSQTAVPPGNDRRVPKSKQHEAELHRARPALNETQRTLRDLVDEAARDVQLPERELVVVAVVQHVEQVRIEWVHIVHLGEVLQDLGQLLVPVAGGEFDLRGTSSARSEGNQAAADALGRLRGEGERPSARGCVGQSVRAAPDQASSARHAACAGAATVRHAHVAGCRRVPGRKNMQRHAAELTLRM